MKLKADYPKSDLRFLLLLLTLIALMNLGCVDTSKDKSERDLSSDTEVVFIPREREQIEDQSLPESNPLPYPVAYTSERDGNREIYITWYAEHAGINVSEHESSDYNFKLFREGGVFISLRTGNYDIIYVKHDNEKQFTNLTESPSVEKQIAISRDLNMLLYTSTLEGSSDIFLFDRERFPSRNLTRNEATDSFPAWMPDGRSFIFESDRAGLSDIFIQSIEGGRAKNLTDSSSDDRFPSISPDGKLLAFESDRDGGNNIYLYYFDSEIVTRVTQNDLFNHTPLFSPDSKYLAWNQLKDNLTEISIMEFESGLLSVLVESYVDQGISGFSPDSKLVLYVSREEGNLDVFYIGVDGDNRTRVTSSKASDYYPVFLGSDSFDFVESLYRDKFPRFESP